MEEVIQHLDILRAEEASLLGYGGEVFEKMKVVAVAKALKKVNQRYKAWLKMKMKRKY